MPVVSVKKHTSGQCFWRY